MSAAPTIDLQLPPVIPFAFPAKGVVETWARGSQPPDTTPDCLNVLPYDLSGRLRGGQRPGMSDASGTSATTYGAGGTNGNVCQWMQQVTVEAGTNTAIYSYVIRIGHAAPITYRISNQTAAYRAEFITLFAGGKGYFGTSSASLASMGGATNSIGAAAMCVGDVIDSQMYLVDGAAKIYQIDFTQSPPAWVVYAATAGTSPASTAPRVLCVYRKRLIVGGGVGDAQPENFYASRQGDAHDWDYGAADPAAPFAGNAAKQGRPGEPIVALIPLGDDALVIGCDRSVWLMNGDIAAGGRIDVITRGVGMVSATAYAFDPQGNLYFVGNNGLYRMTRGVYTIEDLSLDKYPSFFQGANLGYVWSLTYDKTRHGIWIFRTDITAGGDRHLWYDLRTGGFFPVQFPASFGPTRGIFFEHSGNTVAPEFLIAGFPAAGAGSTNGIPLYKLDTANTSDGTNVINAYAWLGPVRPSGDMAREALMIQTDFIMGEVPSGVSSNNVTMSYLIQSGKTAYEAYASPRFSSSGTFTATSGRQTTVRSRLRGESFMVKIGNAGSFTANTTATFELEQVGARFLPGGRVRVP